MRIAIVSALLLGGVVASPALASTAVMVQPKDAVIISGGPGFGSIVDTYNQSGLSAGYIDEVTSVHPYAPTLHTPIFSGFEWFGASGTTTAEVSYLVSATKPRYINHLILWNEESSGIGAFNLWYAPVAGGHLTLLLAGISPPDNPLAPYSGSVYHFAPSPKFGWYTLEMSGCPQPDPGSFPACAIGEVAFGGPVPEPESWIMLIAGFGLVGAVARRRRAIVAA